ncbi:hypothetical protein BEH_26025 (plasmid) [Priestia filamentosa]|uniref:Uncharacterized protein n=1 Tax=Priestia filamentosa TaxID=1402861 RepID=A0A2L1FFJ4_9BACI|nr:spore coat protein [Priestia filamentosa]AVD54509.1 hypothetical protein CKF96_03015 [Priestia filamentosa]AVD54622.1 hypothetical protein CKF96_03800 [Priestia filamentosa]AWG44818.1 hypothetical protein BEH_26025 [Priestia filamentosa]
MARQEIDVKNQSQKQTVLINNSHNVTIHQTGTQFLKIIQTLQDINNCNIIPSKLKVLKNWFSRKNNLQRELHDIENDLIKQNESIIIKNSSDITIVQREIQLDQIKGDSKVKGGYLWSGK